mmetsp:Transcript_19028/g.32500  ORF Transcript_19028/g.32500 Transcript_19028/m.32500 type:complete len:218 (+) Transcript_19028:466-1119(+)
MGLEDNASTLYLIDYGLAKKWSTTSGEHIPYKDGKSLTGTARYASANTHLGIEQSRRDDLEGAGYVLLYLLLGELPWQGLRAKTKEEKYKKIKEAKVNTPLEELTQGAPKEFFDFMVYCRNMEFSEDPDYSYLRRILKELYVKCGFENEFIFDWTIQRYHPSMTQTQLQRQLGQDSSNERSDEFGSLENRYPNSSEDELFQPEGNEFAPESLPFSQN